MRLLLTCVAVHALLAQLIAHPWWTPNVTAIGLTMSTIHAPMRWPVYASISGLALTMWMLHDQGRFFLMVLVLGWLLRQAAGRWQATDGRVQAAAVFVVTLVVTISPLAAGAAVVSWRLLGMLAVHLAVTLLVWRLFQAIVRYVSRDERGP